MGVWGVDSFENDDSADWLTEFISQPSITAIIDTLTLAAEAGVDDYLELAEDASVIAAAEVIAALNHQPSTDLPEEIAEWVETQNEIDPDLIDLALQAIARVKTNSELQDLWANSTSLDEWLGAVNNLEERLKS
jgi:phage-related tail fiber protein